MCALVTGVQTCALPILAIRSSVGARWLCFYVLLTAFLYFISGVFLSLVHGIWLTVLSDRASKHSSLRDRWSLQAFGFPFALLELARWMNSITSEALRVGQECVSMCRYRWLPYH